MRVGEMSPIPSDTSGKERDWRVRKGVGREYDR